MGKYFLFEICVERLRESLQNSCVTVEELNDKISLNLTDQYLIDELKEILEIIPNDIFKDFTEQVTQHYRIKQKEADDYRIYLDSVWNKGFALSDAMYEMIVEALVEYNSRITTEHSDEIEENQYKCRVLQLILNRSLQTFSAILSLLQNGFADQAYMLFRSLYENWIISTFISQSNEETAKLFYQEQNTISNTTWTQFIGRTLGNYAREYCKKLFFPFS